MYYFLRCIETVIDDVPWYKVFILSYDKCAVTSCYVLKNDENEKFMKSFTKFQDVTNKVRFFVKSNGSISIRLAYN